MMNPAVAAKTSPAINPDRTSSGKEHFEVFDGLRGSAAFLIVIFHPFNYSFGWNTALSLVRHAYLAVDFFFGLSGFVVAYAYDVTVGRRCCWRRVCCGRGYSSPFGYSWDVALKVYLDFLGANTVPSAS
jgi:hypothetical protein